MYQQSFTGGAAWQARAVRLGYVVLAIGSFGFVDDQVDSDEFPTRAGRRLRDASTGGLILGVTILQSDPTE